MLATVQIFPPKKISFLQKMGREAHRATRSIAVHLVEELLVRIVGVHEVVESAFVLIIVCFGRRRLGFPFIAFRLVFLNSFRFLPVDGKGINVPSLFDVPVFL